MKIKMNGFTLLEMVVVIAVMGVLGVIFTDILVQTLRGENKVKALNRVKQNGQMVLERLTNEIRQAQNIVCAGQFVPYSQGANDTLVVFTQGIYKRFMFIKADLPSSRNGAILMDSFTENDTGQLYKTPANMCTSLPRFTQRQINLTDPDPVTGVSISFDGYPPPPLFNRSVKEGYNDIVTIRFRVSAGVKAGSAYETTVKDGGILFATSVGARGKQ